MIIIKACAHHTDKKRKKRIGKLGKITILYYYNLCFFNVKYINADKICCGLTNYVRYCDSEVAIGGIGIAWTIEALMTHPEVCEQYVLMPALKNADGEQYFNKSGSPARPIGYAISSSCKDVDAAWRVIEAAYSTENGMLLAWGQLNPPEGKGGLIDNGDGTYTPVPPPEGDNWDNWNITHTSFRANSYIAPETWAAVVPSEDMITKASIQNFYAPYLTWPVMPSCYIFDNDTNEELSVIKTDITSLIDSRVAAWVQGDVDIDADWEDYKAELETLGLARYIEIYTERYNASK